MDDGFQPAGRTPAPSPLSLVQDFVNTEIPEWERDDIADASLLAAWVAERGLAQSVVPDHAALRRAHALRRALRLLALANTTGSELGEDQSAEVAAALAALRVRLVADRDGIRLAPAGDGVDGALATIAITALEARATGAWARLKACRQPTCGWVFYDASRNRSSTWCSMTICGNRTKARRARARRREEAG